MRRHQSILVLILTLALGAAPARVSQAQWQVNGAPVCTAAGSQTYPAIASDGAGGAIITWMDHRNGTYDIYAQRLNASGAPQWTADGVALATVTAGSPARIASDGAGGAIVTWSDYHTGIAAAYAQRLDAAGVPQWTAGGVWLSIAAAHQFFPEIVSDGAGGAIVTWYDQRNGPNDIYAQRLNAAGERQWGADGVALCTDPSNQFYPTIASDGAEGAIVTWLDERNGAVYGIYAQRVNAAGVPQWTADGVRLSPAGVNAQGTATPSVVGRIASDGAEGAIVTWSDYRSGAPQVYVQRLNAAGAPLWTADGVALGTPAVSSQNLPTIVSDGAGGAIVTWYETRGIYAQRVGAAGAPQWATDGVALSTAYGAIFPTIASDGAAGAIVTWFDYRNGSIGIHPYAQRVSAAGAPQWTTDGVPLSTAANVQDSPVLVSEGDGGAIFTWYDGRNGSSDIYAQRVYGTGGVAAVSPQSAPTRFQLLAPFPSPARDGRLTIRFNLPSSARVSAEVLDVTGHRVRTLASDREYSPGTQSLGWDGRNDAGVRLSSGVYFVEVREGTHSEARKAILLR